MHRQILLFNDGKITDSNKKIVNIKFEFFNFKINKNEIKLLILQ